MTNPDHDPETQTETASESSQESTDGDETCPVCGQEYVHKREEPDVRCINHVLRDDFRECRVNHGTTSISRPDTVYVHRNDRATSSERVIPHINLPTEGTETPHSSTGDPSSRIKATPATREEIEQRFEDDEPETGGLDLSGMAEKPPEGYGNCPDCGTSVLGDDDE